MDRLHVLSQAWAAETAAPVTPVADDPPPVLALVARPAALVAMKPQPVMTRGAAKEGTDLLAIGRLTTDPLTPDPVVDELQRPHPGFKDDALPPARRRCVPFPRVDAFNRTGPR